MATREELEMAYNKVFDAQGNVRACGREACIALIELCEQLQPGNDFGDKRTGEMKVSDIRFIYEYGPITLNKG